jgi:SAM-dependent methyltransferase
MRKLSDRDHLRFSLYEHTVQSPRWQVDYLPQFHTWLTGREPHLFREDFCGTARISYEWVKKSDANRALGIDLDPAALRYGSETHRAALQPEERKRMQLKRQDVRTPTRERFDWIGAFNFSCFEFHERKELLRYLRAAHDSLRSPGTLFLEIAGGPAFIEAGSEKRKFSVPGAGKGVQIWEQHQYDPVTQLNDYSIHFLLKDGRMIEEAFHYHWRIWGIRELREAIRDAGFKKSIVLWERTDEKGRGTGELLPVEEASLPDSYVCTLVALR